MTLLIDFITGLPIALVYNLFTHKFNQIVNPKKNGSMSAGIILIASIVSLALALTFFKSSKMKNRKIRIGLITASCGLVIHSIVFKWKYIPQSTQLTIMGIALGLIIWMCYGFW